MKTQTTFRDVNVRVHASKLKFALIFAFIFSVFQSQTYTFTGNGDGTSWTDAANWTGATGIPYIDDTTCSVNVGSFTVTIPSSTNLTMESGTVSGAGKIINNGTFTVISTGSKSFTLATFENKGTFSLGNGTDNYGTINMYNNTVFDNLVGASLIANGLSFSSSGGNTVKNAGVFRKLGEFSENFNVNFTNTGEIKVEAGTLLLNGTKDLQTGVFTLAAGTTLDVSGSSGILSGIWTGTVSGTFKLDGNNSVAVDQTVTNRISGNGITFTSGNLGGSGKFINETIFSVEGTASKSFTLANFENKGTFTLGNGTDNNGTISMYNNTVFDNLAGGTLIANGLSFSSSGENMVKNAGVFRKLGEFSESFNITLINTGEIKVEAGTLGLTGNKDLRTGVFNIAQNAVLDTNNGSSTLSGNWTGNIVGKFYLNGNSSVLENQTVVNQTSGNGITFVSGSLGGSGKFINETIFSVEGTASKSFVINTFENKGTFNLGNGTDNNGTISLYNNTIFDNLGTGEVLAKGLTFINNGVHMVNNAGTFRKLGNFDETFNVNVTNTGNIVGEAGRIIFSGSLNNTTTGRISGFAIGTPAGNNFTNNGILAPGLSPGELNFTGQLKLTNGILEIELNGNTPGTQYDQVSYNGTTAVSLSGNIHVSLGFAPAVGSQFIVVKSATAPITSTLAVTPYAEYEGNHYYFTVTNATNQVVLTVSNITLGTGQTEILKTKVYPNPVVGNLHYQSAEHLVGYELINTAGQNIRNGKLQGKTGEINMDNLKSGMYILILKYRDRTEHMKLIKK